MHNITSALINSTRKAVKFLQRDFFELEMLQRSTQGNNDFCNKSYSKAVDLLQGELKKYSQFLFFPNDNFKLDNIPDIVLLINPLDSLANLANALPFFALSITYLKKINEVLVPIYVVMNFPALNEIYYAEKGGGAWVEKNYFNSLNNHNSRLRVSGRSNLNNALITIDNFNTNIVYPNNIRSFGSHCYEIVLLAAGKLDAVYFSSLNYTLKPGFELIAKESGGLIINDIDEKFIATNYELNTQFKH